jgi:hypothetical protein
MKNYARLSLIALLALAPGEALAWGAAGHRFVGQIGAEEFSTELPAFLRAKGVAADIGEWAREPDRSKGGGKIHDTDRDPAHTVLVDDDGRIMGGPTLAALPPTRAEYETALRAVGSNSWQAGYLPYAMIDGWQQLVKDFTYWRILKAALAHPSPHHDYYAHDLARREKQTIMDLGIWAHFVGDASQPLHVTVHHDGWGDYPNPKGYAAEKIHGLFEGDFVHKYVTTAMVRARLPAPAPDCGCGIEAWTVKYLTETGGKYETVYQMWRDGDFSGPNAKGEDFAAAQIAMGAGQLRDMTLAAWRASDDGRIGFPVSHMVSVKDAESGARDPYDALMGED